MDDFIFALSTKLSTNIDIFKWIKQGIDYGVGEILITSIDQDGTLKGYDLELIREVSKNINIPLVVRLAGTNFKEGKEILDNSGVKLISAENLDDAAKKIVEAIK